MNAILFTLGILIFFTACSRDENPPPENPPVGVVSTLTYEFTLHAGPEGTLYTVRDRDGKEIAREISSQDLAADFPALSEELRGLWAGNDRVNTTNLILKEGSTFDALDKPAPLIDRVSVPSSTFEAPERSMVPAR